MMNAHVSRAARCLAAQASGAPILGQSLAQSMSGSSTGALSAGPSWSGQPQRSGMPIAVGVLLPPHVALLHTASCAVGDGIRGFSSSAAGVSTGDYAISSGNPVIQRYRAMLEAGSLQQDEQQWSLVQKLAALYDEICSYSALMDEHHKSMAEHQARRMERLQQLLAEDTARRQREEEVERARREADKAACGKHRDAAAAETGGESAGASDGSTQSWGSWFRSLLPFGSGGGAESGGCGKCGGSGGCRSGRGGSDAARSERAAALAKERQAAARREETLMRELGPPPKAPEPPRGLYVWGSVGSGKSMLVGLLHQALSESGRLPACRWMHFNAAMLEIHARLHHLDSERTRLHLERQRAHADHAAQLAQQAQHGQQPEAQRAAAAQQAAVAAQQVVMTTDEVNDDDEDDEEEDEDEVDEELEVVAGGLALPGGLPVRPEQQGVFRHWDPATDPEVARQRDARAAMLAIRRHMRLARLGRNDPRNLAAANAQGLVRAAAAFIRGRPGEPLSGWAGGSGPLASLLVFDEVQVTDVFSAVALKGLVEALSSAGCVLVATSNRAPMDLPRHGLHEAMWGHFLETLLNRCTVHELSSPADYRRKLLEEGRAALGAAAAETTTTSSASWPPLTRSYMVPGGPGAADHMEALWRARVAAGGQQPAAAAAAQQQQPSSAQEEQPMVVPVLFGRTLEVRRASPCGRAAWFSFEELCGRPLGPADYVALSQRFDTVFVSDVPAMSMQVRDQARRFITLVDELYNGRCLLVASAAVSPEELFVGAEGQEPILDLEGLQFETAVEDARLRRDATASGGVAPVGAKPSDLALTVGTLGGAEERFAFRRAVSRLLEMQSHHYMTVTARTRSVVAGGAA